MSRCGIFKAGRFLVCGEPPKRIPRCIGRAVNGPGREACTCPTWPPEVMAAAARLEVDAETRADMVDGLAAAGWSWPRAMAAVYPRDARRARWEALEAEASAPSRRDPIPEEA